MRNAIPTTLLFAAFVVFASGHALAGEEEHTQEQEPKPAHRQTIIDASFGAGFIYRTMNIPPNIDVCIPIGKHCPTVGSLESNGREVGSYGGLFHANFLKMGPLRIGTDLTLGGTNGGIEGAYGNDSVQIDTFFYGTFALSVGLAANVGPVRFALDGNAGFYSLYATTSLRSVDGLPLSLTSVNGMAELRGSVSYFVTPHVSISGFGGAGVNQIWHAGFAISYSFDALDR